jgi:hypothetical protein
VVEVVIFALTDQGLKPLAILGDPFGVTVLDPKGSPEIARGFNPWNFSESLAYLVVNQIE